MLYYAYEAQRDAMAGMRLLAETARRWIDEAWPLVGDLPLMRGAAAAMTLLSQTGLSHERQPFGFTSVSIDGADVAVSEETAVVGPFCNLLHFRKAGAPKQPKLLIVAPLSGHFATLLRGTVATALPDHDVYLTDWINARNVPLRHGRFGLDDFVDRVIDFIHFIGPGAHVMAGCPPSVPGFGAGSLMGAAKEPRRPRSLGLVGGPIDPGGHPREGKPFV